MNAQTRQWGVLDGLPTGEVRQIIALPNHQMLVNCEGVFCISNGAGFTIVPCDRRKAHLLEHYADSVGYGHRWQGDSLLWLRDFYRIYLFDMRTRSFRYDIAGRLSSLGQFSDEPSGIAERGPSSETVTDWQGGTWTGTLGNGIAYTPPQRQMATILEDDPLIGIARRAAELNVRLSDGRLLQRRGLNRIGYFLPDANRFDLLNDRLPQLNDYRNIVGACALTEPWVVLYTQNGACLLDTKADTLADFKPAEIIDEYSDKYNCMLRDTKGNLWVGTQNGLFNVHTEETERVTGLANNCIRSLVMDARGNIWAGTACGISRITPTVVNYGEDDGVPAISMMERAACLTGDGRLVFVHHSSAATVFRPEWLTDQARPQVPVLTLLQVNDHNEIYVQDTGLTLPYSKNHLTIQFSSLDYAHPSHTTYRYRLRGLEDEWHSADGAIGLAEADYKALPPGEYVFEAQAASTGGEWSNPLTVQISIRPPFWLTWWAKALYALLLGAFVAFSLTLYLKKKKAALVRENDSRVNRLFEMREEARHQFAASTNVDPKKIGVNPEEEVLVARLLKAIEAHIADEGYGVEQLATDVALSRTNLYGKLRDMLGISPADFIRNVRLKRAAQLLTDNPTLSINEVSIRVGFSTPRNFSTQFKKMFGVLPSEYRGAENH
ncbi:MAG: helix-turn-helix domain-containing protein [Prevotella sp.]|nr:helix-turn-helix domain-containing protein [Prevotella sp.]